LYQKTNSEVLDNPISEGYNLLLTWYPVRTRRSRFLRSFFYMKNGTTSILQLHGPLMFNRLRPSLFASKQCMPSRFATAQRQISSSRQNQPIQLPRLPIPDLRSTLDKYLTSIQPFLREDEANGLQPFDAAYAHQVSLTDAFAEGIGKICQQRLIGRSQ
jgi:hypothetical protein